MAKSSTVVITYTICFIILEKLELLHLLPALFDHIVTTPEIAGEYRYRLPEWVNIQAVHDNHLQKTLSKIVDAGEASAIALAAEIQCDYLLTDDKAARRLAEERGISVKGSGGILSYAKKQGKIPFLRPYLEKMQQTNFRISPGLIQILLRDAGE
jgi:predicted nucleic acid-binding protein